MSKSKERILARALHDIRRELVNLDHTEQERAVACDTLAHEALSRTLYLMSYPDEADDE